MRKRNSIQNGMEIRQEERKKEREKKNKQGNNKISKQQNVVLTSERYGGKTRQRYYAMMLLSLSVVFCPHKQ